MRILVFCLPGLILLVAVLTWPASGTPPEAQPLPFGTREERQIRFAVTDESGFERKGKPQPGDWLDRFDEPGQDFEQYHGSRPPGATKKRHVLAFMPVGEFDGPAAEIAGATYEFAGIWFDLPIRVLKRQPVPDDEWCRMREFPWQSAPVRQIQTDYFLRRLLPPRLPDDAVMLSAITMEDLYPSASWNYVFGIASLRQRIAVYSLLRFFAEFWGEEPTDETRVQALRRSIKLVTHELGHTFGMAHCIAYECNMNGSNSLGESDRQPLHLCPVCLRKLRWNRGFDVLARYRKLLAFYREHRLEPEAAWTADRIERVESVE